MDVAASLQRLFELGRRASQSRVRSRSAGALATALVAQVVGGSFSAGEAKPKPSQNASCGLSGALQLRSMGFLVSGQRWLSYSAKRGPQSLFAQLGGANPNNSARSGAGKAPWRVVRVFSFHSLAMNLSLCRFAEFEVSAGGPIVETVRPGQRCESPLQSHACHACQATWSLVLAPA